MDRTIRRLLVTIVLVGLFAACTPQQMLMIHRDQNSEGPYRQQVCETPAETGTPRWDCAPAKVSQLRAEANYWTRWHAINRYVRAMARSRESLVWHWSLVANCESGGDWGINTGNGYYGGVQFSLATWRSVGGSGYPHQNSAAEQAYRADILRQRAGLGQWPHCGRYYR